MVRNAVLSIRNSRIPARRESLPVSTGGNENPPSAYSASHRFRRTSRKGIRRTIPPLSAIGFLQQERNEKKRRSQPGCPAGGIAEVSAEGGARSGARAPSGRVPLVRRTNSRAAWAYLLSPDSLCPRLSASPTCR